MSSAQSKGYQLEEKVLQFSNLKLGEELFVYDVEIQIKGKSHKIHTYRCGDNNTETLVLLHGYGGSSLLYYSMLKDLSKRFRVFCLDFAGMGLSSREKFECKSTEETLDFFVDSVEKWREAVGLEKFCLAGHSFGGYISGHYTKRHQHRVIKLFLLSPAGVTKYHEEPTPEEIQQKLGFFKKMFFGFFMKIWDKRMTPAKFFKDYPWIASLVVKNYVYNRFNLRNSEADIFKDYLIEMMTMPEGSAEGIHYLLRPPLASAYLPLEDVIIEDLKIPVDCFYGESDYMDTTGAKRIDASQKKENFTYKILPQSAHQLPMQNPKGLAEAMVLSLVKA